MSSDDRNMVLTAVNQISEKTIKDLHGIVVFARDGIKENNDDVRKLSKFVFGFDIDEKDGFIVNPGNDFNAKVSGIYKQHMTQLSAIETRIKKDAPEIAEETSFDIRIIRNTLDKYYKFLCSLFTIQETLAQPMLADAETTIPVNQSGDLNPFQIILLDILDEFERQRIRKDKNMVAREIVTPKGFRTMSWEPECLILEKIHSLCDKNTTPERWLLSTKRSSMIKELSSYLEKCIDVQFPEIVKNRHAWSFRNGVFIGDKDGNRFFPYGSKEFQKLDMNMVTSKYFDQNFIDHTVIDDWRKIPTPHLDSIMNYQRWDEEVKRWMYIHLGRLTFAVNEFDSWQIIAFCKGIAMSGKSTLLNYIAKIFYVQSEVSVVANNIEERFGLAPIKDSKIFIGPEIKSDWNMDQAQFQSIVSGEEVSIPQKGLVAITKQWDVPGILAGNEVPAFSDNSGSVMRRLQLFKFTYQVSKGDPRLGEKILGEIGNILQKCIMAYVEAVHEYGNQLIWDVLPDQFKVWRKEIEGQLHSLVGFMETPEIIYGEELLVPLNIFRSNYRTYCSNIGAKPRTWKLELYEGPFSQKNVTIEIGDFEWRGQIIKNREYIKGLTVEEKFME